MPELPDVEFARRKLERVVQGATVSHAECADLRLLRPQTPRQFAALVDGGRVQAVERRGKWLRISFEGGSRLFSHLGMTGWWDEYGAGEAKRPFERARLDVTERGGSVRSLRYVDARRFGRLLASRDDIPEWTTMGPDLLVDGLSAAGLRAAIGGTRRAVKDAVMDQTILAGIGNIIATEALWHAQLDPRSNGAALTSDDFTTLARSLLRETKRELAVRTRSRAEEWRDTWAVYGRDGEPCPRCETRLSSVVIAGRTSVFCKGCQVRRKKR